jgi:hypothetical protein
VDRHRFDADPDPDTTFHFVTTQIWNQNLPEALQKLENQNIFLQFIYSNASFQHFGQ